MIEKDIATVRELAKKVAEYAALPEQNEKIRLWKKLNALKPERPMFTINQVCWNEMNVDDELTLTCEDDMCRGIEWQLRETLYRQRHMADDRPVMKHITIDKAWGVHNMGPAAVTQDNYEPGAQTHVFVDQLPDDEAMNEKLIMPTVTYDREETARRKEKAQEILNGILSVKMTGFDGYFHYWDRIAFWRGVEPVMYDIADNPEYLHRMTRKVVDMHMCMLDQVEKLGLITAGMDWIHCTGAYNDVMKGYDDDRDEYSYSAKNSWTYSAPQLFSMVSPETQDEFDVQYIIPWYERFGLGYYGCCEPEDIKVDILRKVPNLRKISMSPWINEALGAEKIGKDFVYSRKPNPANVAWDTFPEDIIADEFRKTLKETVKNSCPTEFILKDITTVRNDPTRLWKWAEIARSFCK